MKPLQSHSTQRGVALVVALLFLLVVTVISVVAASNSSLGLRMAANQQDGYSSFQAAEAGVLAVLSLAGGPQDPFDGFDSNDPLSSFDPNTDHPLREVFGGTDAVDVNVFITDTGLTCPRRQAASSVGLFECDYYRVTSEHQVEKKARSKVQLGVVKTTIGSSL